MRINNHRLTLLLVVPLLLFSFRNDNSDKSSALMDAVIESVTANHYMVPQINDNLSQKAYGMILNRLDNGKRFFIKQDIDQFDKFKFKIDNQINSGSFEFLEQIIKVINQRINEAEEYYKVILNTPFNYNEEESFETDPEKLNWAEGKKELEEYWRKSLKYQTLSRLVDKMEAQEKKKENPDSSFVEKSFEELESAARKSVLKSHNDWFRRLHQLKYEDHLSLYVNSIVNVLDPHTAYYPPKQKEDFDIQISGRLEGIGATLQESDGYIKVTRIVPGSASWKQGELKAGDLITQVAQDGEEPVDVVGMRLDDAVKMIRGKKGTKVILTVKKIDGDVVDIPIIRDVVIIDESYAKSAIIKDKNTGTKVGFIHLPQFYVDFTNTGGRRCSVDMAKEVRKLKEEDVDGIVIDLRDNGGGSLQDVVDIAGLFIKTGPVVQVKGRWGTPYVLSDRNPDVQYDGPLAVLVNANSASASEIFAAAMQDYGRAIIIGGKETFGKGTVQRFYELDRYIPAEYAKYKPFGSMKISMQKFYRINGASTQLKGVTPDIVLPDNFKYIDYGERELDYPMPWNEIKPYPYSKWQARVDYSEIVDASNARVMQDSIFTKLDNKAKQLKVNRENSVFSLELMKFRNEMDQWEKTNKKYSNIQKINNNLEISSLKDDITGIRSDSSKMARIDDWHKRLQKDHYVFEAVNVMDDFVEKLSRK